MSTYYTVTSQKSGIVRKYPSLTKAFEHISKMHKRGMYGTYTLVKPSGAVQGYESEAGRKTLNWEKQA